MTSPTNPQPDEIERAKGGSYFQAMAEANAEIIRLREQIAAKDEALREIEHVESAHIARRIARAALTNTTEEKSDG
jgi:uncharacterized protein YegP (UPF0339 family)